MKRTAIERNIFPIGFDMRDYLCYIISYGYLETKREKHDKKFKAAMFLGYDYPRNSGLSCLDRVSKLDSRLRTDKHRNVLRITTFPAFGSLQINPRTSGISILFLPYPISSSDFFTECRPPGQKNAHSVNCRALGRKGQNE